MFKGCLNNRIYDGCVPSCPDDQLILFKAKQIFTCVQDCDYPYQHSKQEGYCEVMTSDSETNQIKQTSDFFNLLTIAAGISSVTYGIVKSSNLSTFLLVSLLNLLQYIKYLSINYPPRLERMLNQQDLGSFLITLLPTVSFETAVRFGQYPLPRNFSQYGVIL